MAAGEPRLTRSHVYANYNCLEIEDTKYYITKMNRSLNNTDWKYS